jgi:hypothetical protein
MGTRGSLYGFGNMPIGELRSDLITWCLDFFEC